MQNDYSSQASSLSLQFNRGVMNDGAQRESVFTVEADVVFHAASDDTPISCGVGRLSLTDEEEDEEVERVESVPEMGSMGDSQAYCRQRTTVTKGAGAETESASSERHSNNTGHHHWGREAGTSDTDAVHVSTDRSSRVHFQQWDTGASQLRGMDPARGQSHSVSRNGTTEEAAGTHAESPCSLGSSLCFPGGTKEETERAASLFEQGRIVRSQCQINNANCTLEEKGTSLPAACSISMGTEPTGELGHLASAGHGTDWREYDTIQGNSRPESDQGARGHVVQDSRALKAEPDLVIEVAGKQIQAHKSVLAEKSDYFKARQSRDILKVKGVTYKTLMVLIEYVYSSRMEVNKDNVIEVITGAKILQIPCAVQAAMDTMSEQITAENCYEILCIAKKQRLSDLKETVYRFMSDNFLQILKDPSVYGRLTGLERDLILKTRMEGKKSLMVAEINDVYDRVGSRPPSRNSSRPQSPLSVTSCEDIRMIYHYNESTKEWKSLTLMPDEINTKGCGICTMYNYLFVAGGIKGSGDKGKLSDKVFCYNPVTDSWSEIRPLNQARSQLKLLPLDGYLYAIGGECLFTVEKYDPRMDRWTPVAPLPKGAFAVAHEATTCNGEIYVSGGSLFYRLLKYDPKRDEWQECPYNNSRKRSTDMVALKSFIYRFDVSRDKGVSVFKYNTIVKMWHDCATLPQTNPLPFRCAVMGSCIYCVNKSQTLRFVVGEEDARFEPEHLNAPEETKGVLFPFVLSLPEKADRNL
ncbi:kelch repeat and BTB domain-containing protein 11 [Megalops cyprinoides]|uniref:kelch repeat and BTB domain-containing protein 11 n=1 Tax=Megalops cyprinoides TaxID=118141 RepID=UPI0018655553|nr:kelch repeat and BTB domain-containing protein 11 [Megalops cyprinoides]